MRTSYTADLKHSLIQLLAAVRGVRAHRQMNAAEPPEMQDAWDRLAVAVLEAERLLVNKPKTKAVDKRRR